MCGYSGTVHPPHRRDLVLKDEMVQYSRGFLKDFPHNTALEYKNLIFSTGGSLPYMKYKYIYILVPRTLYRCTTVLIPLYQYQLLINISFPHKKCLCMEELRVWYRRVQFGAAGYRWA